MNSYKLKSNFLESEIEEIIFMYRKQEDSLEFSDYSCAMLGIEKKIYDPFHNPMVLSRLKSESLECIVSKMNFNSSSKQTIKILFMNKPFILKYQCDVEDGQLQSVVCLLKEKIEY